MRENLMSVHKDIFAAQQRETAEQNERIIVSLRKDNDRLAKVNDRLRALNAVLLDDADAAEKRRLGLWCKFTGY